jgi:acetoin:2,6-dichlorophenolindophenol oxidoreductase subunit alpha
VCENNLYGEYSRIDRTTPVTDIAVRATSYAMPGDIVDGQDMDEVYAAVAAAVARARQGGGPTLVEAKTYRYAGHSRSDKATYRWVGELDKWLERDPITLFGQKLVGEGVVDQSELDAIKEHAELLIDHALEGALASPPPTHAQMLAPVTATAR